MHSREVPETAVPGDSREDRAPLGEARRRFRVRDPAGLTSQQIAELDLRLANVHDLPNAEPRAPLTLDPLALFRGARCTVLRGEPIRDLPAIRFGAPNDPR